MRILSLIFVFGGYTLVYASVARGGLLAEDPWMCLFIDAYTGEGTGEGQAAFTQDTNASTATVTA